MPILRTSLIKNIVSSLLVIVLLTNCTKEYQTVDNTNWDTMYYAGYYEASPTKVYTLSLSDKIK